jgi:hypothetical protein
LKTKAHLHLPRLKAGVDEVISAKTGDSPVEYFGTLIISDARFIVSAPGRKRTLDTKQRNVHAWVVGKKFAGIPSQHPPFGFAKQMRQVTYNPYKFDSFVDTETFEPVEYAYSAYMVGSKVYYIPKDENV